MGSAHLHPETLEERLVYWSITGTWLLYGLGALYVASPVLVWSLAGIIIGRRLGLLQPSAIDLKPLPIGIWVWIVSMIIMAIALLMGHLDFDLDAVQTLKSLIGWMKGWALMAVFVFAGGAARIRPQLIYRASNILGLQTIILAPFFWLAPLIGLPGVLYVSPLDNVGGPGPEFFSVYLYAKEPMTGAWRWMFFAPWAPAAACVASVGFILALYEKQRFWKAVGIVAAIIVCVMSQSRMSLVAVPAASIVAYLLSHFTRPWVFAAGAGANVLLLPFAGTLLRFAEDLQNRFLGARADSTRVRATLQNIAYHRWGNEAPVWGHGTVERGPHIVEYMPIGSHHTWFGLLYVKGIVGLLALAVPMMWSVFEMVIKAQSDRSARCALGILLVLTIFSFGENLEILVYLFWPGLLVTGAATKHRVFNPFESRLGAAPVKPAPAFAPAT